MRSIPKFSVAFNLKNSVLCTQHPNNTSSLQLKGHTAQGDVGKEFGHNCEQTSLLPYKRSSKALQNTQMHRFSSTPMKKRDFKILSSPTHSSINAGKPFRSPCSLSGWVWDLSMHEKREGVPHLPGKACIFPCTVTSRSLQGQESHQSSHKGSQNSPVPKQVWFPEASTSPSFRDPVSRVSGMRMGPSTASQGEFLFYGG